jgi:hypothetical protein
MGGGGGVFQKPNVGGLGVGVRPTDSFIGSANPQYTVPDVFKRNPNPMEVRDHGDLSGSMYMGATPHMLDAAPRGKMSDNWWTKDTPIKPNYFDLTEGQLTADEVKALQLEYDNDEALRQDKLDKMSQLAQGQGGSGGGVSGQIVGDGGDLNIQQVAMERGKDGFPTLADFEQPLHPFLGKRRQRYS